MNKLAPDKFYLEMPRRLAEAMLDGVPSGTIVDKGRVVEALAQAVVSTLGSFGAGADLAVVYMGFLHEFHRAAEHLAVTEALHQAVDTKGATKQ